MESASPPPRTCKSCRYYVSEAIRYTANREIATRMTCARGPRYASSVAFLSACLDYEREPGAD